MPGGGPYLGATKDPFSQCPEGDFAYLGYLMKKHRGAYLGFLMKSTQRTPGGCPCLDARKMLLISMLGVCLTSMPGGGPYLGFLMKTH